MEIEDASAAFEKIRLSPKTTKTNTDVVVSCIDNFVQEILITKHYEW